MRAELVVKGRSLTGSSDLTLLAPIKPGLVPSLDTVTYRTRAQRLLKTLNGGRASMHEYALQRPLSDAVERVTKIHSFRVAILEPENKVLLAVTFDGTWESYIRVLWQKVGTLLDVIFCNTEGYVVSHGHGFDAWAAWVRKVQIETEFFFNTHALTVEDVQYLRGEELVHRRATPTPSAAPASTGRCPLDDLEATRQHVHSPEDIAWAAATASPAHVADAARQGLQSLAVLFRLTDLYLPGSADGDVLQRAARDILLEFTTLLHDDTLRQTISRSVRGRFDRQIGWLLPADLPAVTEPRQVPALPARAQLDNPADVQGGILRPYDGVTHGCLLLIAFDRRDAAAGLLDALIGKLTTAAADPPAGEAFVNLALTYEGLRFLGMAEEQLAWFPQEFREGMEARASMLGDFRANHPRRWRLPLRNWQVGADAAALRVEMSTVHLMVQLRIGAPGNSTDDPNDPAHPLHAPIRALFNAAGSSTARKGVRLLSVQPMRRYLNAQQRIVEHFGFADGDGQPALDAGAGDAVYPNQVQLGELLLGYPNEADPAPQPVDAADRERLAFLANGSFLVVRKLRQDVAALHRAVREASAATGLDEALILAKMMGRYQDGRPLVNPHAGNDFHYGADPNGSLCPFHAHIRRANPRQIALGRGEPPGRRRPRLMRRGMSYGPPFAATPAAAAGDDGAGAPERGLVFMAYNASIAEQFEVVQRWITGGNSAGGYSGQSDPFLGVPEVGMQRSFRFEHEVDGQPRVLRIALDSAPALNHDPEPFVRLEWGAYGFTPSLHALRQLRDLAAFGPRPVPVWSAADGERLIQSLLRTGPAPSRDDAIGAWKSLLEDPESQEKFVAAGVWAAIRENHGGVLRTPYGVLVADRDLVMEVLGDHHGRYTVAGYRERMRASIGEIYLGLDEHADGAYARQSGPVNRAIAQIGEAQAFELARRFTAEVLQSFIDLEKGLAAAQGAPRWELNLDVKEVCDAVLARLCQHWFGLPTGAGAPLVAGPWRWDWQEGQPPIYPGQFTAPSRYIFQPHPGAEVRDYGCRYGRALTAALAAFVAPIRAAKAVPHTPDGCDAELAAAILAACPTAATDDEVARTFAGALMGLLPTVDGNLRLSLNEWLRDGTFWSLRAAWPQCDDPGAYERATQLLRPPLLEAMQLRPSPELVWRTATGAATHVGAEPLAEGDLVVLALVSATQQGLGEGRRDVHPVFGGERTPDRPHPTHACPGYQAGMGVLLGMLAAMVAVKEPMRPSPAPLAFTFEGRLDGPAPGPVAAAVAGGA
ncbi:MAG: hypothetical protein KGL99_17895 [Burkholderiales bacterium]|nr:hypothetical protein [Burkholderiales bacterium]